MTSLLDCPSLGGRKAVSRGDGVNVLKGSIYNC